MMEFIKKYQIILGLSFIVMTMSLIKVFYKVEVSEPETKQELIQKAEVSPTPTIKISPTPRLMNTGDEEVDSKYPLWQLLPYSGKGFVVDRYIKTLTLAVKAKGLDKSLVEEEVILWMEENGVDPETHKIQWE